MNATFSKKTPDLSKVDLQRLIDHALKLTVLLIGDKRNAIRSVLAKVEPASSLKVLHHSAPQGLEESNPSMVMIDHAVDSSILSVATKSVERKLPVFIGAAGTLPKEIWQLKLEAQAKGLVFEIATDLDDYADRIDFVLTVAARQKHEDQQRVKDAVASEWEQLQALPGVSKAAQMLRADSGRLDAGKVAELFDLKRSQLAALAARSPEAVRVTPDAKSLQDILIHFERIAGLLALLENPKTFRTWLNAPNSELDGRSPLQLILERRWEVVENLVADILENRGG